MNAKAGMTIIAAAAFATTGVVTARAEVFLAGPGVVDASPKGLAIFVR